VQSIISAVKLTVDYNNTIPNENSDMELAQPLIEYVLNVLAQVVVAAPPSL
jgi:hypothetical protein